LKILGVWSGSNQQPKLSTDHSLGLGLKAVLDPQGVIGNQSRQFPRGKIPDLTGFIAGSNCTTGNLAQKGYTHRMPFGSLGDMQGILRIRIDADQPDHFTPQTGFLVKLPRTSLGQGLAQVHVPARNTPKAVVGALGQKHFPLAVEDQGVNGDFGRGLRLVVHALPLPERLLPRMAQIKTDEYGLTQIFIKNICALAASPYTG
jgi:hypothetical protein